MAVWRSDSHTNVRRWFSHQVKIYSSSMHQEDTTGLIRDPDGKAYLAFRGEDVWTFQFLGIEGDTLVFSSKRPKTYRSEPSLEILSQFEQLATGDSQAITRFARKYGALGLCRHGRPVGLPMHRCQWPPSPPSVWREPLKSWQVYAKRVRAILLLVSDAYGNTSAAQEQWQVLNRESMSGRNGIPIPGAKEKQLKKIFLAHEIRTWLRACGTMPAMEWAGASPSFRLRSDTLLGEIGVALMSAVLRGGGVATCSDCGRIYAPKRKPPFGRNHFCPACGLEKRGAKRLWARDARIRARDSTA